jgi:SAM-dependent methyltransferase
LEKGWLGYAYAVMAGQSLRDQFGDIDIYLFDQLLRERIRHGMRVFDSGCGAGRNLVYLLRAGFEVHGSDADPAAIAAVHQLAARLAPALPASNFRVEPVEQSSQPDGFADVVVSSAVLHFARDAAHFQAMVHELWRVLAPNGLLFCRLASSIGMPERMVPIGAGRYRLPDGSERFLADEALLLQLTDALGGRLVDPLKTTVVQDQRCMTTWVVRKAPRALH